MQNQRRLYLLGVILIFCILLSMIFVACNDDVVQNVQKPDDDVYGDWIVQREPTCLESGLKYRTNGKGIRQEEEIPALGHDFGDWRVVTEATTMADGLRERTCSRCNEKEEEVIGAIVDGTAGLEYTYWQAQDQYYITGPGSAINEKNLVIPSKYLGKTVIYVYKNSLNDMPNLETVTFSKDSEVTAIYNDVFNNCKKLKSVEVPASVVSMVGTFAPGCDSLEEVSVSPDNTAFCSIDGVVYDKNVTTLIYYPRAKAGAYTLPETVDPAKSNMYLLAGYANKLTAINISNSNTKYQSIDGVLYNTSIHDGATWQLVAYPGGRNSEEYEVYYDGEHAVQIGNYAFYQHEFIKKVTFNASGYPSTIGQYAFWESALEEVVLKGDIYSIDMYAFGSCKNLRNIDFAEAEQVSTISQMAFYDCTSLTEVTMPKKWSYGAYRGGAFAGCTNLQMINVLQDCENYTSIDGVLLSKDAKTLYEYPNGRKGSITLPESVKNIASYMIFAYSGREDLTTTEDGVMYLGNILLSARNTSGDTLTILQGTKYIAGSAFSSNSKYAKVIVPESVTSVGEYAFYYTPFEIEFAEECNIEYVAQCAFKQSKIQSINLPKAEFIGKEAFAKCKFIKEIILGTGNGSIKTTIGDYAFQNYECVIEKLVIGPHVISLGKDPFTASRLASKITDVFVENEDVVNKVAYDKDLYDLIYTATNLYVLNGMNLTDSGRANIDDLTAYSFQMQKVADSVTINGKSYMQFQKG